MQCNKVLVTGGSGFVGLNLKEYQEDWTYISSKEFNLESIDECRQMMKSIKPDAIVHLAGKVGGISANASNQMDFFDRNILVNFNVLRSAREYGVKRLLAALSTCCFPKNPPEYPMSEKDMLAGPPEPTNFSYAMAKRTLFAQVVAYRAHGLNWSCFTPSNIYGPHDHFNQKSSHFVAALVSKRDNEFLGTGSPRRQQLYVKDLCKIIPKLLDMGPCPENIIIAPPENLSIKEMVEIFYRVTGKNKKPNFSGELDGIQNKECSSDLLHSVLGKKFLFTPFEEGIKETYDWYVNRA